MLAARSRRARTNSRGEATREQLLAAAVELLREKGYAGLSIAAVCARADVAPTAVYWHFGNKAGLMEAVLARISGGYVERIRAEVAAAERPAERLDRLIAGIRALVTTQPLGSLTGVAIVGEGRHVTPELREALRSAREREFEVIAGEFAAVLGGDRAGRRDARHRRPRLRQLRRPLPSIGRQRRVRWTASSRDCATRSYACRESDPLDGRASESERIGVTGRPRRSRAISSGNASAISSADSESAAARGCIGRIVAIRISDPQASAGRFAATLYRKISGSTSTPAGQWSEPITSGWRKAPRTKRMAAGEAST